MCELLDVLGIFIRWMRKSLTFLEKRNWVINCWKVLSENRATDGRKVRSNIFLLLMQCGALCQLILPQTHERVSQIDPSCWCKITPSPTVLGLQKLSCLGGNSITSYGDRFLLILTRSSIFGTHWRTTCRRNFWKYLGEGECTVNTLGNVTGLGTLW